jgi:hypothetical protein
MSFTGHRADNPVRTLSDQVGERISAAMEGSTGGRGGGR